MSFVKVKGTYDVLPNESKKWHALETYVKSLFERYNYQEIRTPIMEYSNVIHRESEGSDMVTKETYNFKDKADRNITLRPEGTAGVVRSFVENKLFVDRPLTKLYYIGPNFRYERPQKGRYRQFMQFGVEALGSFDPMIDSEVISMAYETINGLGLKGVVVKVNSLGDELSKSNYQKALFDFLKPFENELSEDSKIRLYKNPLRILDSKDPVDKEITKNAPLPLDYLTQSSKQYFDKVIHALDLIKVPYSIDKNLVRGLDYYTETVFEIQANIEGFGAQNALGGGGRYQNLVKELGGPQTPGIGYAFGMERLLNALEIEGLKFYESDALDAYLISFNDETKDVIFNIQNELRVNGIKSDMNYHQKNFKGQLKEALQYEAKFLLILGENELESQNIIIKNTRTEQQITIPITDVVNTLKELLNHV